MKSIMLIILLSFSSIVCVSQKSKTVDLGIKYTSSKVIGIDTLVQMRIPVDLITSDAKYRIDALQKRLDKINARIFIKDYQDIKEDISGTKRLLDGIPDEMSLKTIPYYKELNYYSKVSQLEIAKLDSVPRNVTQQNLLPTNSPSTTGNSTSLTPRSTTSSTPSSSYSQPYRQIQTGPRGGKYYINKNGNKTYIKKK